MTVEPRRPPSVSACGAVAVVSGRECGLKAALTEFCRSFFLSKIRKIKKKNTEQEKKTEILMQQTQTPLMTVGVI